MTDTGFRIEKAPTHSFANAVKWSYVMDGGRQVATTVVTFLLARILGPEVLGLAAMALGFVMIIQMLQTQGMAAALIQRKDLHDGHLSSAFWAILAVSLTLTVFAIGLAGWWADINDEPQLRSVIWVLSAIVPIQALSVVQEALFRRRMDFKTLALRTNAAVVGAGLIAVTLVLLGAGIWALVAQQLASAAIGLVLLWVRSDWKPSTAFSASSFKELLAFSGLSFVATLAVFVGTRSDALIIGLLFGPTATGLFFFANRLVQMVTDFASSAIQGASLPELSRNQDNIQILTNRLEAILSTSAIVAFPLLALVAGASVEIVDLLGRTDWEPAADVVRLLTVAGAIKAITLFTGPFLQSTGRPGAHALLSWAAAILGAGSFVVVGYLYGDDSLSQQVTALASSRVLVHVAFVVMFLLPLLLLTNLTTTTLVRALWAPVVVGGVTYMVTGSLMSMLGGAPTVAALIVGGGAAALLAITLTLTLNRAVRLRLLSSLGRN